MGIHDGGTADFLTKLKEQALRVKGGVQQPVITDGRRLMVGALDALCQDPHNLSKFYEKAQEAFDGNPLIFYDQYIKPLIGKSLIDPVEKTEDLDYAEQIRQGLAQLSNLAMTVPSEPNPEPEPETKETSYEQQPDDSRQLSPLGDYDSSIGISGVPEKPPTDSGIGDRSELESETDS